MKVSLKTLLIVSVIIILAPIFIGIGVSADILNDWTNSNDWIGFWGSYAGAVIGGIITLYVMYTTIKSEKELEKDREKTEFGKLIIEKNALLTEGVEDTAYRAHDYIRLGGVELMRVFSSRLRSTKAIVLELYTHFEIRKDRDEYLPAKASEVYKLLEKLHVELGVYEALVMDKKELEEKDKIVFDMINELGPKITDYVKELTMTSNKNNSFTIFS